MNKYIALMVVIGAVTLAQTYAKPSYGKAPEKEQQGAAEAAAKPYEFSWTVKDEPSNNDYAHQEKSDGKVVTGSYRVLLPDGRTQIVTYKADENGYVADVKYEGEAKAQSAQPAAYNAAPAYPKNSAY